MDKDTSVPQVPSQSTPNITQLQSQVINDGEVHTTEISESEDFDAHPSSVDLMTETLEDDTHGGCWDNIDMDWDTIEIEVQNIEKEHEVQDEDNNEDEDSNEDGGFRVEVRESDSGSDGGQDEDNNEDNIWDSDIEVMSHCSDLEEQSQASFNELDLIDPKLELGMKFSSRALLKEVIYTHAILTKKDLKITKNEVGRMHVKCKSKKCKWRCHANKVKDEETYYVHSYNPIHSCNETNKVSMMKSGWLSKRYKQKFISHPDISVNGFRDEVTRELDVSFSKQIAYRARKKACDNIYGDPVEQYSLLWDFIGEVKRTNPSSTLLLGVDEDSRFHRMYVCLGASKKGWTEECRPVIGVDGCHLMDPHKGVLLPAVGIDANNNIYPIAWAVVGNECFDSWDWFLSLLKSDLHLVEQKEYTFISDKQKGLLQAFDVHFKESEKRFCVRHLLGNFKRAGFTGEAYKSALWAAAGASTVNSWDRKMEAMFNLDPKAVEWFNDKPPKQWSRSHFSTYPKCDILLNNGCESFNQAIKEARNMPILSMMDWLMVWAMKRLQQNRDHCKSKWKGKLCPKIQKQLQKNIEKKRGSIAIMSNEHYFRVETNTGERFYVNLQEWTCGCRKWDLRGIPCSHACATIIGRDKNPKDYVHDCFWVESYKKAYEPAIIPINGKHEWRKTGIQPSLPPNEGRSAGRPTQKRRLEPDEQPNKGKRKCRGKPMGPSTANPLAMKKQQSTVKCSYCGVQGHNKTGCQKRIRESTSNLVEVGEPGVQIVDDGNLVNHQELLQVEVQIVDDGNEQRRAQETNTKKLKVRTNPRRIHESSTRTASVNVRTTSEHIDQNHQISTNQSSSNTTGSVMQSLRKGINLNSEVHATSHQIGQPYTQPPSMFQ